MIESVRARMLKRHLAHTLSPFGKVGVSVSTRTKCASVTFTKKWKAYDVRSIVDGVKIDPLGGEWSQWEDFEILIFFAD